MSTQPQDTVYFHMLREGTRRLEPKQRPLAQFLSTFLSDKQAEGTSAGYRRELERVVANFTRFLEQGLDRQPVLSDFTLEAVRAFILSEQQRPRWLGHPKMKVPSRPLSAQMVQNETRMLRVFASWLDQEEFTRDERGEPINVLRRLKLPKVEKKEIQPLTPEEETTVIRASDPRTHAGCRRLALVMVALDTGARVSEIAGLRMEELHLEEGYIRIRWETAKGKKDRVVVVGHQTARALKRYLTFFREPATAQAEEYLFLDTEGYPITAHAIQEVVKRIARRTGIPRLHPHLFRHTFGTRAAENNVNTLVLQNLMGHSSSKVTELYTHLAGTESLKHNRRLSHVDGLPGVKVRDTAQRYERLLRREKLAGNPKRYLTPQRAAYMLPSPPLSTGPGRDAGAFQH